MPRVPGRRPRPARRPPAPSPSPARSAGPGAARRPRWPPGWRRSPAAGAWPGGPGCWRAGCWCRSRSRTPGLEWSGSAGPHPCRRPRRRPAGKAPRCPGRCGQRVGAGEHRGTTSPGGCPQHPRRSRGSRSPPLPEQTSTRRWKTAGSDAAGRGAARTGDLPGSGGRGCQEGRARAPLTHWAAWPPRTPRPWWCADSGLCSALPPGHPPPYPSCKPAREEGPVSPGPSGLWPPAPPAPRPSLSNAWAAAHLSFLQTPAPSPFVTPRRGSPGRSPKSATRHPPLRALPVPGAGRRHRMPAAGAAPARRVLLPFARAELSRVGGGEGGHSLFVRGHPWEDPRGRKTRGALCKLLHAHSAAASHSPAALGRTAGQSSGRSSGRLTFRSFALQQRIPPKSYCNCRSPTERERRGSSCTLGRAGAGSVLLHRLLQRPPPPRSPPRQPGSLARHLRAPRSVPAGAAQPTPQLPHSHWRTKAPAYESYPANPQPTTSSLICIRAAIGPCKSVLETIWPQLQEQGWGAEGGGAERKLARGPGAGLGCGGRGLELTLLPLAGFAGQELFALEGSGEGLLSSASGWSRLPSVFLDGAHFFKL